MRDEMGEFYRRLMESGERIKGIESVRILIPGEGSNYPSSDRRRIAVRVPDVGEVFDCGECREPLVRESEVREWNEGTLSGGVSVVELNGMNRGENGKLLCVIRVVHSRCLPRMAAKMEAKEDQDYLMEEYRRVMGFNPSERAQEVERLRRMISVRELN